MAYPISERVVSDDAARSFYVKLWQQTHLHRATRTGTLLQDSWQKLSKPINGARPPLGKGHESQASSNQSVKDCQKLSTRIKVGFDRKW